MSTDTLLTLRQLAEKTGLAVWFFRQLVYRGELAVIRRTPTGRIHVTEAAWQSWKAAHTCVVSAKVDVDVSLDPPKKTPVRAPEVVSVDHLITKGFKSPIARSY